MLCLFFKAVMVAYQNKLNGLLPNNIAEGKYLHYARATETTCDTYFIAQLIRTLEMSA